VTRGWKVVAAIAVGLVALNLGLRALRSVTGGSPGGRESSSYATKSDGVAAYAELLGRAGHEVRRLRVEPRDAALEGNETAVVLDPPFVLDEDAKALRAFVSAGGRLVTADASGSWFRDVVDVEPKLAHGVVARARPLAPVAEVAGVRSVRTRGLAAWEDTGAALPILGRGGRVVAAVVQRGNGRAVLLADPSPLWNELLDEADDAAFALAAAGPASRPVVFFETYHGYGRSRGLAAIPGRWWTAFALGAFAVVLLGLARGRRFGPPEADERDLAPPRREYVESLAGVLARTRAPREALAPVRAEVRRRLARRTGIPPGDDDRLAAAARRLGFADDEIAATLGGGGDVLAAGRALARLGATQTGGRWRG
jgi:Domain of unknown function (DUF4350)